MTLDVITPVSVGSRVVSSSVIRRLVAEGDVSGAAELLGANYRLRGLVTTGAARGRTLGFPTANLIHVATEFPKDGVYAGRVLWRNQPYRAAINIGPNPTFAEHQQKFEVHLLDFQGDLYGETLDVEFIARLRETRAFNGIEELVTQLKQDIAQIRAIDGDR